MDKGSPRFLPEEAIYVPLGVISGRWRRYYKSPPRGGTNRKPPRGGGSAPLAGLRPPLRPPVDLPAPRLRRFPPDSGRCPDPGLAGGGQRGFRCPRPAAPAGVGFLLVGLLGAFQMEARHRRKPMGRNGVQGCSPCQKARGAFCGAYGRFFRGLMVWLFLKASKLSRMASSLRCVCASRTWAGTPSTGTASFSTAGMMTTGLVFMMGLDARAPGKPAEARLSWWPAIALTVP